MNIEEHRAFRMALTTIAIRNAERMTELLDKFIRILSAHLGSMAISWRVGSPRFELQIVSEPNTPSRLAIEINLIGDLMDGASVDALVEFFRELDKNCRGTRGYREFLDEMKQYGYRVQLRDSITLNRNVALVLRDIKIIV